MLSSVWGLISDAPVVTAVVGAFGLIIARVLCWKYPRLSSNRIAVVGLISLAFAISASVYVHQQWLLKAQSGEEYKVVIAGAWMKAEAIERMRANDWDRARLLRAADAWNHPERVWSSDSRTFATLGLGFLFAFWIGLAGWFLWITKAIGLGSSLFGRRPDPRGAPE